MPCRAMACQSARAARFNGMLGLTKYCWSCLSLALDLQMIESAPSPTPNSLKARLLRGAMAVPVALTIALAGCSTTTPKQTASIAAPVTTADYQKGSEYWGQRYAKNPKDRKAALNFAAALRNTDKTDQAVAVLQKAAIFYPNDHEVLAAYGKALAANGQLDMALDIVRRAQTPDQPDWRLLSAEAAILDQLGTHDDARRLYKQALGLAPNDPTVLSNLGMSYVLTGDLKDAEATLRQAAAVPNVDSRVRQNLALVVGLEGRFADAEKIASDDLPPDQAAANVAYLKTMLVQQNNWQKLKAADAGGKLAADIPAGGV